MLFKTQSHLLESHTEAAGLLTVFLVWKRQTQEWLAQGRVVRLWWHWHQLGLTAPLVSEHLPGVEEWCLHDDRYKCPSSSPTERPPTQPWS